MRHLQLELRDFRNHRPPNGAHDETHAVCVERVRQLQPSEVSPLVVQDIVRLIVLCPSQDLDKWQTAKRVVKFPSLLEFLGHSSVFALSVCVTVLFYSFYWFRFFFPGVLVGPYLDLWGVGHCFAWHVRVLFLSMYMYFNTFHKYSEQVFSPYMFATTF